jgi:hypothetical protein
MKQGILLALAILILCLPALAQQSQGKAAAIQMQATATVTAIDQTTRMVTLKTADGKELTTKVSPEVKNLKQVKVGDVLNITYTVAFAVRINPTTAAPSQAAAAVATAKPGEKPAAVAGDMVTINAKVEAIDLKANTVTFKGPKGNVRTVAVQDPAYQEKLKTLKVGDVVEITYAEALAITVEAGKKK